MGKRTASLLPATDALVKSLGERLRVARLRRRLAAKQVAERAGMSVMTLRSLERGSPGVTLGAYLAVMQVLGLEQDLNLLAKEDPVGRELQDAQLPRFVRTTPSRTQRTNTPTPSRGRASQGMTAEVRGPLQHRDFVSSSDLSALIEQPKTRVKRKR